MKKVGRMEEVNRILISKTEIRRRKTAAGEMRKLRAVQISMQIEFHLIDGFENFIKLK